ncbi:MAG: hypothetical protein K2L82_08260 [Lachnospiraceae bacterium]|nr:hypothetical protein [Lachnospiraceae bacterium]
MAKKNIFLCDIELPEIVQEKADEAFSMITAEGKKTMKANKNLKNERNKSKEERGGNICVSRKVQAAMAGAVAVAACAMLVVGTSVLTGREDGFDKETGAVSDAETTESSDGTILSALDKMFTLRVRAEESTPYGQQGQSGTEQQGAQSGEKYVALEAGHQIPLVTGNKAQNYVLGGDEETGMVNYCINMPFSCEGESIEKVTYSINNGAFQIVQEGEESIIVDGEIYVEDDTVNGMNCGMIGGSYSEETGLSDQVVVAKFYKSFTLDYQKQSDEHTWINIANNVPNSEEIIDLIWGQDDLQAFNSGLQKMLDNTVITCTVQYSDNTSQSVDIKVSSQIMTYSEAGEAAVKGDPNEETIYITFELQE